MKVRSDLVAEAEGKGYEMRMDHQYILHSMLGHPPRLFYR